MRCYFPGGCQKKISPPLKKGVCFLSRAQRDKKQGGFKDLCRTQVAVILTILFALTACTRAPTTPAATQAQTAAHYNTQLGLAYLAQGDAARAQAKLLRAHEQDPQSTEPLLALAYFYEQTHADEAALQSYQQALQLAPSDPQIHNNYGIFLCQQGEWAQAQQAFAKAMADPHYPQSQQARRNADLCQQQADTTYSNSMGLC